MNVADGSMRSPSVEAAQLGDSVGIKWLLDLESLPTADLTETALEHFLVVRDEIGVIGVVGLEVYGQVALLRSLVVANSHAGRGIGRGLVVAAESLAATAAQGTELEKKFAFRQAFKAMETRIKLFLSLPLSSIDSLRLKEPLFKSEWVS